MTAPADVPGQGMTTAQACAESYEGSDVANPGGYSYLPSSPLLISTGANIELPVLWNGWTFNAGGLAAYGSPWDAVAAGPLPAGGAFYAFLQVRSVASPSGTGSVQLTPATLSKSVQYLGDTGVVAVSFAFAPRTGYTPLTGSTLVCTLAGVLVSTNILFPAAWTRVGPVVVALPEGIVKQDQALLQFSLSQATGDAAIAIDLITVVAACPALFYAPPGTTSCLPCPASALGATSCVPPTCSDGLTDGGETDVDCGGPIPSGWPSGCVRCALSRACTASSDCAAPAICTTNAAGVGGAAATPPGVRNQSAASASPVPSTAPLVGVCVDPQLATAFWLAQGGGGSPAVVGFSLAAVALVAPAALSADGLAVLQAALPCAASAAFGLVKNGTVIVPGIVGAGSVAVLTSSAFTATARRASLQMTLLAANVSANAPPSWAVAVAAQVAGGALAPPQLLPVLAACVAALHLPASAQAAAAAWAQALASATLFSVGAASNASVPDAFVTIEQELAARRVFLAPGTGAASGGSVGGDFSASAGIGVGVAIVVLVLAGGAFFLRGGRNGGGGGGASSRKLGRRPQFERAADGEAGEEEAEGDGGRSRRATFNPVATAASSRQVAAAAAAGAGWLQCEAAATGQVWFVNLTTNETTWDLPAGAVVTKWMKQ